MKRARRKYVLAGIGEAVEVKKSFNWNNVPWIPVIGLSGLFFFGEKLKSLFSGIPNPFATDKEVTAAENDKWWNPGYYVTNSKIIPLSFADTMADTIYTATHTWKINVDADVIAQIKQLKYKTQVSILAARMLTRHGVDLYHFLTEIVSTNGMKVIIGYVNSLPTGLP